MHSEPADSRYFGLLLQAIGWQVLPIAFCAATFRQSSQLPAFACWLLLVVPLLAGGIHALFIAQRPTWRSVVLTVMASAVGGLGILAYAGLAMLLLYSTGAKW